MKPHEDKLRDLAARVKLVNTWKRRIKAYMTMDDFCKTAKEHHTQMSRWVCGKVTPTWRVIHRIEKKIEAVRKKLK
jgi:hypothetical protein